MQLWPLNGLIGCLTFQMSLTVWKYYLPASCVVMMLRGRLCSQEVQCLIIAEAEIQRASSFGLLCTNSHPPFKPTPLLSKTIGVCARSVISQTGHGSSGIDQCSNDMLVIKINGSMRAEYWDVKKLNSMTKRWTKRKLLEVQSFICLVIHIQSLTFVLD